jgi:uncharacterized protein YjbI with pentapeptide repeats
MNLYENFQNIHALKEQINTQEVVSGLFLCDYDSQSFYDTPCREKTFQNCIIVRGSFIGTNFTKCQFINVVFRETEFETCFVDCIMKDCIFSNVDSGFTMENTKVENFSLFHEEEMYIEKYIHDIKMLLGK